ncbi:MAG TPA: mechanosensitive ion channel domain-containing protein [Gemmataceae bacterium]|nr:mechanosensitive ion channel domain-containing protein [Gemmataceae bacterium]
MQDAISKALTSRKLVMGALAGVALVIGAMWLIDPEAFPIKGPTSEAEQPGETADAGPPLSAAERIAHLQHDIEEDRQYLDKFTAQLKAPDNEYNRAEKRFQKVDEDLQQARQAIQQLKDAGKAEEALARAGSLKDLQASWQRNRDRFNLAIKEHKTLQQSIAALERKIEKEQQTLDRLSGVAPKVADSGSEPERAHGANAPPSTAKAADSPGKPAHTRGAGSPSSASSGLTLPESPLALASSASAAAPATPSAASEAPDAEHVSREVQRAREEAKLKEEAAKKAEGKAQSITQRMEILRQNVSLAKKMLDTARQRADHEQQTRSTLEADLQTKTAAKAPEAELKYVSSRIEAAQRRLQEAQAEVRSSTDRLHDFQGELSTLQNQQIAALHEADAKKQAAEDAEDRIAYLQNPFRPRNIVQWLFHHGPRLFLITLGMIIFYRLSRVISRRAVRFMAQTGTAKRGTHQDRENRAQTLVGVFNSTLSLFVLGGGALMIFDEVGIPIVPLMGGAAVLGLAVAFGAQNLIKDYFSGFMVLLEDQYGINDVVRIGSISGLVEHISLRTTVLRDLEGIVHFIPHGTITTVSNLTHGWSRALFDVGIAYKEDVDRVMQVLLDLGRELRQDATFGPLILDDPEMLGVDGLADSSVVLKFFMKTLPLQQWTVKREMLRRIKNKFDALGIEIPFPHQTVYHRYETPPPAGVPEYAPLPVKRAG